MKEFLVRRKREFVKLPFTDIVYVESWKNYVQIVTAKNKLMVKTAISRLEKLLPRDLFCRVHRGYIVSINAVVGFNHSKVHLLQRDIPISEQYRKRLLDCFIILEDKSPEKKCKNLTPRTV